MSASSTLLTAALLAVGWLHGFDLRAAPRDAKADADKKFEVPKDAIKGTVKSVNMGKRTFTIILSDKKERTFVVDKATEFWGPKGGDRGTGPAGLKDDCMAKGYEIRVVPAKDDKTAKDVYLPTRKADDPKKDTRNQQPMPAAAAYNRALLVPLDSQPGLLSSPRRSQLAVPARPGK
jgi:hypothetical protein